MNFPVKSSVTGIKISKAMRPLQALVPVGSKLISSLYKKHYGDVKKMFEELTNMVVNASKKSLRIALVQTGTILEKRIVEGSLKTVTVQRGPDTTLLVGSLSTLRSIAKDLRKRNQPYRVERIHFREYNSTWNGFKGVGLRVTLAAYHSLYQDIPNA
jgi:hypothetical protein